MKNWEWEIGNRGMRNGKQGNEDGKYFEKKREICVLKFSAKASALHRKHISRSFQAETGTNGSL